MNLKIWRTIFFGTSKRVARFNLLDFSLEVEFSIAMMVKFLPKVKIEFNSVIKDAQSNRIKSMESKTDIKTRFSNFLKERDSILSIIIGYCLRSTLILLSAT